MNTKWKYVACHCSPPFCPELNIIEDDKGTNNVVIYDDYNGICYMSIDEFKLMATNFLEAYNKGEIREFD